jgi:hypothetical protein
MDHGVVVRQKLTERYLLGELDPMARDEFEEHYFDCQDCALDVRAGALFVEQSKVALAEDAESHAVRPVPAAVAAKPGRLPGFRAGLYGILRPAFAVPVMALLLAVIGYQNLVTYPQMQAALNSPQVLPWTQVNVGTYGSGVPVVTTRPGKGFLLFVRIPPEGGYTRYTADLYNPAGKMEWSLTVPVPESQVHINQGHISQDQWPVRVPDKNWEAGNYRLVVRGITSEGESKEVGPASFELQIRK